MIKKTPMQIVLVVAVLAIGLFTARWLISNPPRAEKRQVERLAPLVNVRTVRSSTYRVRVSAMGTVVPAREVSLRPELTGRIIEQSPRLVPGGLFQEDEMILRIDPRDYEIAVRQREADVAKAHLELKQEKGRKLIAEREWKLLEQDIPSTPESRELALREPQQENAEAALSAAESALELARLNLERTVMKAPFNALVKEEFVDEGQLVTPQTSLATLTGTDSFWVQVSIPVDRLKWIVFPEAGSGPGSEVRVTLEAGPDVMIERKGHLERLLGDLDPAGRMARALVSVDDPLGLKRDSSSREPALLLGAYVRVEIQGRGVEDVFVLPRIVEREGSRVWTLDPDDRLEFRDVNVLWRTEDEIVVSTGLQDGERVVTTRIASPIPGMKLRVSAESAQDKNNNG